MSGIISDNIGRSSGLLKTVVAGDKFELLFATDFTTTTNWDHDLSSYSAYDGFYIWVPIFYSSTNGGETAIRIAQSGSYQTSGYHNTFAQSQTSNATEGYVNNTATDRIPTTFGTYHDGGSNFGRGAIRIWMVGQNVYKQSLQYNSNYDHDGGTYFVRFKGIGGYNTAGACDGLRFYHTVGTMTGTSYVFGVKN